MKKALLIGIKYIGTKYELGGCINDINNIEKFITENCEYKIENITKLTDETNIKPTFQNIIDSIYNLVKDIVAGDSLIFYYSGSIRVSFKKKLASEVLLHNTLQHFQIDGELLHSYGMAVQNRLRFVL